MKVLVNTDELAPESRILSAKLGAMSNRPAISAPAIFIGKAFNSHAARAILPPTVQNIQIGSGLTPVTVESLSIEEFRTDHAFASVRLGAFGTEPSYRGG